MKKLLIVTAIAVLSFTGSAYAISIAEIEPNDSFATAQNIDAFFSLDFDFNIGDKVGPQQTNVNTSTIIPHVTVRGIGEGAINDFFRFTVSTPGSLGIFDIDFGSADGIDTTLTLFDSLGNQLEHRDDEAGDPGSEFSNHDAFVRFIFATTGPYAIRVGNSVGGSRIGGTYLLQVSIENHAVGELPSLALLGFGLIAVGLCFRFGVRSQTSRLFID